MRPLKRIWLSLVDLFTLARSLPQFLALAVKQRHDRAALNALEV